MPLYYKDDFQQGCVNGKQVENKCDPCHRCRAKTKSGTTCKNKACTHTSFCSVHLRARHKLAVGKSRIRGAGNGVFAMRWKKPAGRRAIIFKKGQNVIKYTGKVLTKRQLAALYRGGAIAPYVVDRGDGKFIDGARKRSVGALINHGMTKASRNVELVQHEDDHGRHSVWFVATDDICEGDELLADYGPNAAAYLNARSSTKRVTTKQRVERERPRK